MSDFTSNDPSKTEVDMSKLLRTQPRKVAVIRGKAKHTFVNIAEEEDGPKNPQLTTKELYKLFFQHPPTVRLCEQENAKNIGTTSYLEEIGKVFHDWMIMSAAGGDWVKWMSETLDSIRITIYNRALSISLDESAKTFRCIQDNGGKFEFCHGHFSLLIRDVSAGMGNIYFHDNEYDRGVEDKIVLLPLMTSYDKHEV